ncbi:hypothetical protein DPEC_G00142730 [Dallia pectoralis]|uniref:Uncharacterized protein n=1 Tax=Dallia pectoralis TaxID=75939 RepID=A0ACC2GN01_DALPE|nr:hypothetical protein DPEC_G00142730 [Dallia pectoralis]
MTSSLEVQSLVKCNKRSRSGGVETVTGAPVGILLQYSRSSVMQTQGSTSSQPSFDSLSSGDSYLFGDSEQAEDDTDVFLSERSPSVILGTGDVVTGHRSAGVESPGSQWACDSFTEVTRDQPSVTAERERTRETEKVKVEGDLLFAQKCAELQGFVRPLLELLNGLRGGRFDRGLSSFQQSVAIDRIQRIVGIIRRPNIGEKYMNTLLRVEMMLKMWFPQVSHSTSQPAKLTGTADTHPTRDTPKCPHLHKHTDQSHIPVKKRRLSWSDTDCATAPPVLLKRLHTGVGQERVKEELDTPSPASGEPRGPQDPASDQENDRKKDENSKAGELSSQNMANFSEPSFNWAHVAPLISPRNPMEVKQLLPVVPPPSSRGSPAMQDSSISSTTPILNQQQSQLQPINFQSQVQPIGCQSQLNAGIMGVKTLKTCQEAKTLKREERKSRVNPAPLES